MEGAYQCVQHLIDNGHRDIGFIGPIRMTHSNYERWMGYRMALSDYGLEAVPAYSLTESNYHSASDEEIGSFLDRLTAYPTAWFCANDNMAITLLNELNKRSVQVPQNNIELFKGIDPIDDNLIQQVTEDYLDDPSVIHYQ